MTIYEKAVSHYGAENQVRKSVEELTELSIALQHSLDGRGNLDNIREEMADVSIMLEQLEIIFGKYEKVKCSKIMRLAERIRTGGER